MIKKKFCYIVEKLNNPLQSMKKISFLIMLLTLLLSSLFYTPLDSYDRSMGLRAISKIYLQLFDHDKYEEYKLLRDNYTKSNHEPSSPAHPQIPRIIHQIWLGNSKIPQQYLYYHQTWQKLHPHWEIKIWTDADLNKFPQHITDLISDSRSFAEKADILRLEILKKFGGIYVDMDTLALLPIDETISGYNFVAATAATDSSFEITNSLIASTPNHPILNIAISYLRENWNKEELKFDSNSGLKTMHHLARNRTMYPLEFAVTNYLKYHPEDIKIKVLTIDVCNPFYKDANNFFNKTFYGNYRYTPSENTRCIHFNRKDYSLIQQKDFLLSIFEGNYLNKYLYKYLTGNNIQNKMLEASYQKNSLLNIEFSIPSKTPLIIHLVNLNHNSDLAYDSFKKKYPEFKIKIWSQKDLEEFALSSTETEEIVGLNIVNKYGGVYISSQSLDLTINDLPEYASKYKFFAFIQKKSDYKGSLSLDSSVIGSAASQKISATTLNEINHQTIGKQQLDDILTNNYYKFWQIDGPVICLP